MKMKRLVGLLLIVCMTVGLFYPTGQVSAETESSDTTTPSYILNGKKYDVYYEDDFSDGGTKYNNAIAGFSSAKTLSVENKALMKPSTLEGDDNNSYRALFTTVDNTPSENYSVSATFKMVDNVETTTDSETGETTEKPVYRYTAVVAYADSDGDGYEFGLIEACSSTTGANTSYFRIYNRTNAKVVAGGTSILATNKFGSDFNIVDNELTLRLEASTVDNVVTLKGYAIYDGTEKLVCETTSTENTNVQLKSGVPGLTSTETAGPISYVSIISLGEQADANCLYSDDFTSRIGYRHALGYPLGYVSSDNSYEYTWNSTNPNLTTNSSGNTYSAFRGIENATTLQNYTISADVVEATSVKANGLVAYMTLSGSGGSTGYEFRLYQGKFSIYGRNTSITAPSNVAVTSFEGWEEYTQGETVRLSMTILTSDVSDSTGTVRIICAAEYKNQVKCIFDENTTYTGKAVYQGAPGIRSNDPKGTIDNIKVTAVGELPFYADFEENPDIAASIFGSNLTVTTKTADDKTNTYGTVNNETVYSAIGTSWNNYAVEADVTLNIDASVTKQQTAGLIVGYIAGVDPGYEFDIYKLYEPEEEVIYYWARLMNKTGNVVIKNVRFDFESGQTVQLRVEVSGKQIMCYADGELLISESITLPTTHTGTEITGSVGLRAVNTSANFDNISVESYEASDDTDESIFPFVEDFDDGRPQLTERWGDNGRLVKLNEEEGNRHAILANYFLPEGAGEDHITYDTKVTSMYLTGIDEAVSWADYVYEADVTLTDDPIGTATWKVAAIVGAVQDSVGYEFGICTNGTNYRVRLYDRVKGDVLKGKDSTSSDGWEVYNFALNETVRLKMIVSGNTIQCYVNDELMIDYVADESTTFTGTIGLVTSGNAATFDNIIVSSAADYYPLAKYRSDASNYTHPYKSGHVFGGWYQDNQYTTPLAADATTTDSGCAYARWVAEEVLSVKAQLPAGEAVDANGRTVMRIVTTTDCDAYTQTGFDVSTVNQSKTYTDTRLFTSIKAKSEYASVAVNYTPSSTFHETSKYFSTIILYNLKATDDHLTKEFTIKPFWVTADGTKVYGVTRKLTIQEGIDALANANPYSL